MHVCLEEFLFVFSTSINFGFQITKTENETEPEAFIETIKIEPKPLATELERIDTDFPINSNTGYAQATNPLELNEIEQKQFGGTLHECSLCGKCFQKRWNFIEHMRTHSNDRPFECSSCHKKWVGKINSKYPTFIFLQNKLKVFSIRFKTSSNLRMHCKNHCMNKPKKCDISIMELDEPDSIAYFGVDSLRIEVNEVSKDLNHDDQQIGIKSSSQVENRIDQPILMKTMPESSHSQFSSIPIIGQIQSMNGPIPKQKESHGPYECDKCGRIFAKKWIMIQHRMIHSDKLPFECWLCHKMLVKLSKVHDIFVGKSDAGHFKSAISKCSLIELIYDTMFPRLIFSQCSIWIWK